MALEFRDLSKKEYDVTLIPPISLKLKPGIFNSSATLCTRDLTSFSGIFFTLNGEAIFSKTDIEG